MNEQKMRPVPFWKIPALCSSVEWLRKLGLIRGRTAPGHVVAPLQTGTSWEGKRQAFMCDGTHPTSTRSICLLCHSRGGAMGGGGSGWCIRICAVIFSSVMFCCYGNFFFFFFSLEQNVPIAAKAADWAALCQRTILVLHVLYGSRCNSSSISQSRVLFTNAS